jgi:DNA-binding transcriptional MerR regulator
VLRTWEAEFPELGIAKSAGGPRVYRREDVEHVARIRHLLLVEGLTLAGARRRLEEEASPGPADSPVIEELIGRNVRERLVAVKRGLNSILELLAGSQSAREFRLTAPVAKSAPASTPARRLPPRKSSGRKAAAGRTRR